MAAERAFWGSVTLGLADSNPLSTNASLLIYGAKALNQPRLQGQWQQDRRYMGNLPHLYST